MSALSLLRGLEILRSRQQVIGSNPCKPHVDASIVEGLRRHYDTHFSHGRFQTLEGVSVYIYSQTVRGCYCNETSIVKARGCQGMPSMLPLKDRNSRTTSQCQRYVVSKSVATTGRLIGDCEFKQSHLGSNGDVLGLAISPASQIVIRCNLTLSSTAPNCRPFRRKRVSLDLQKIPPRI